MCSSDLMAGIEMTHVPYKGAALALTDVMAGQIQMSFSQPLIVLPHLKSGRVKALAITSAKRSTALPDYPTIAESGLAGYESSSWQGIVVPAGTTGQIIARLHGELVKAMTSAELKERLSAAGIEPMSSTPEQFAAFIKSENTRFAKVIKDAGIKPE